MSETTVMWMEISFNIAYLLVIWAMVIAMLRRQPHLPADVQPLTRLFIGAFGLLALGDTGHVGFRVWAYGLGSLESTLSLFGREIGLVGLGALATAYTVTLFYMAVLLIWQKRYGKAYGWFGGLLWAAGVFRLVIMLFPGNDWNSTVPPQTWSLIRNVPLMIQGFGVAYLILRDARAAQDRSFVWVGVMILVSYAFYLPVILFVRQMPMIGMLMIPKTMAYVAIAFIAYDGLFKVGDVSGGARPAMSTD